MTPWYAPTSFKEYSRRLVTLRTAVLLCALVAVIATEFRFNWLENAVGAYLASTNSARPESGAIWDQGRQSELARETLSQFMNQRQDVQREVRRATSLAQVLAEVTDERGAMISAAHFIELYLKLPPVLSHEIVSPFTLLSHLSSNKWQRTFFERQSQQVSIYLLDDQNQVLHRLVIGPALMEHIAQGEVAIHTSLHQLGDFADHIYPAEQFFNLLNSLPEQTRKGIVASPEELLRISGRIVKVGISSESMGGITALGFEVEDVEGPKVILTQGRTADIEQLLGMLQSQPGPGGPGGPEVKP
jgi:hypothetical protein